MLGLLLLGGSLRQVIGVVTSFTLAHSVTLALASLAWVRLPAAVIEPLIAASIVCIAVENLLELRRAPGRHNDRRPILAFAFGLVHGFGFAGALAELHLSAAGLTTALLSFNAGVELGQAAIVAADFEPVCPAQLAWGCSSPACNAAHGQQTGQARPVTHGKAQRKGVEMNTRTGTWKHTAPVLKTIVAALGVAWGVGGTAMAATEEASFTARAQANQAIMAAAVDHVGTITSAPNIASEAASFISRVQANQGIAPNGIAGHDAMSTGRQPSHAMAPVAGGEAESFITRVVAHQGLGPRGNRS